MSLHEVPRTECHLYKIGTAVEIKALVDRMVLRGWAKRTRPLTEAEQDNIKQAMEPATVAQDGLFAFQRASVASVSESCDSEFVVRKGAGKTPAVKDDLTIARDEIVARRRAKL